MEPKNLYGVTDFGPGPVDDTQGVVFTGTEAECELWMLDHAWEAENNRPNECRYGIGFIEAEQ